MTRDEAVKIVSETVKASNFSGSLVDSLVALGMLKLDEPKSAIDEEEATHRLLDACRGVPYLATCIDETLAKAGLRIVEK